MPEHDDSVVKNTNQARQGVVGHHVWVVLAVSLLTAAVLFAMIYAYYFG